MNKGEGREKTQTKWEDKKTEKQELIRWDQSYKGGISGEGREEVRVEKRRTGMEE